MTSRLSLAELEQRPAFADRHIGPSDGEVAAMLRTPGCSPPALAAPLSEASATERLRELAARNEVFPTLIGLGYHATLPPPVIQRNIIENPAWYTAYTPYQPEISQGRLEALLSFQTVVSDLTGLPLANASLLDEGTAAAEAMTMARRGARARAQRVFAGVGR
ncbi:MAG TPA: hypothetical protein PKE32_10150, partial [Miltoncostaeaceae bacterium]|nr:hypothetical protein [Miltoncostaeaceae bacterium]